MTHFKYLIIGAGMTADAAVNGASASWIQRAVSL